MSLSRIALSALLSSVAAVPATAVEQKLPSVPIAPPVMIAPHTGPSLPQLVVTWAAQDARCDGAPVVFAQPPAPRPGLRWSGDVKSIDYGFTVDDTGRPLDVARVSKDYAPGGTDLTPALVAARFAPGDARRGCTLRFVPTMSAVSETPAAAVMTYIMFPEQRPTSAMFARARPAGSTCFDPAPQVRNRAFPAFDEIPKRPGVQGWSMVGFDIDARGKPIHLRREAGSGNVALDKGSVTAVADSRFAPGARTGCQYPYWVAAATLPPPPMPEEAAFRPAGATCPSKADWAVEPPVIYPPSFGRRRIEGWAIIGYDVAPWGETGNLRVLAAQPAAEFGEQAMGILRQARRAASATGYVGCVDRVVYRMPEPGMKPHTADTAEDVPPPF